MIWDIIYYAVLIYIGGVVLWHLFFWGMMIVEGYSDDGFWGALGMGFFGFISGIWSLAKFAISILIIAWLVRSCSGNDYVGFDSFNISADSKSIIYFIDAYDYNNPPEYNDNLEKFKKKINAYSKDEIEKLKEFARLYINYRNSFAKDFVNSFIEYIPGSEFAFSLSEQTDNYKQKLLNYNIAERLEIEDKQIEELIIELNSELPNLSSDEVIERQSAVVENDNDMLFLMGSIYKSIFEEELSNE